MFAFHTLVISLAICAAITSAMVVTRPAVAQPVRSDLAFAQGYYSSVGRGDGDAVPWPLIVASGAAVIVLGASKTRVRRQRIR